MEPRDQITFAVRKCPFLHELAEQQGEAFARNIAINPTVPAAGCPRRPILEEAEDFQATFRLFHGPQGVVPLRRTFAPETAPDTSQPIRCPFAHAKEPASVSTVSHESGTISRPTRSPLAGAPLATMSLSFGNMPDFGGFFNNFKNNLRKPNSRPEAKPKPTTNSSRAQPNNAVKGSTLSHSSTASTGGTCPMRKMLGPLAPLVFNPKGHFQCPEVIIRARAALAATQPVRELRPQSLPVKLLAVAGIAAALNVPCGMWREHTEKFSAEWILAVHATIPFIAMLRKAVIMPKYAIIFTIAAAVAGQAMGAKLERQRMAKARPVARIITAPPMKPVVALASSEQGTARPKPSGFKMQRSTHGVVRVSTCSPCMSPGAPAPAAKAGAPMLTAC